jgi:hypothetical protein
MKIPALLVLITVMVAVTGTGRDIAAQERVDLRSQFQELRRRSLRGLQGVEVLVERMKPVAQRHGLTDRQVQTDVELRLHRAGIRVLTADESEASPYLYINIIIVAGSGPAAGLLGYSIAVELKQFVWLMRDPDIRLPGATTWDEGSAGLVGQAQLRSVREELSDLVDKFINE